LKTTMICSRISGYKEMHMSTDQTLGASQTVGGSNPLSPTILGALNLFLLP
jgi:hypothetical protein